MSASVGFLTAAVQLGVDTITFNNRPKRTIDTFTAQVTLEEKHTDNLEIVEHPVELGAPIADHSFLRPAELVLNVGWSNSPGSAGLFGSLASAVTGTIGGVGSLLTGNSVSQVKDIYDKFLKLQRERRPFDVSTGKRLYKNMLIRSIDTSTTSKTENALLLRVALREILVVSTKTLTISAPPEDQENPEVTEPTTDAGTKQLAPATTYNEGAGSGAINPAPAGP